MKILVLGNAGFIGSHLADSLIEDGHEVHGIDNLSTGKKANIHPKTIFHQLDISKDFKKIIRLFKQERFDYVYHLAAIARIPECLDKPLVSFDVNVRSTLWLLQQSREWGARFIFSSSSSVYGEVKGTMPIDEGIELKPISMYGLHKLTAEQLTLQYAKFYGLRASALRYFNVYGTARQSADGAYPNVFSAFNRDSKKGEITIFGDGEQRRDYVHVLDVVRANKEFLWTDKGWGEVFNIGTGETHTVNEVARYFSPKRTSYQPPRAGDPLFSCARVSRIYDKLGFKSKIGFEEGVQLYLKSVKEAENVSK